MWGLSRNCRDESGSSLCHCKGPGAAECSRQCLMHDSVHQDCSYLAESQPDPCMAACPSCLADAAHSVCQRLCSDVHWAHMQEGMQGECAHALGVPDDLQQSTSAPVCFLA